MCSFHSSIHWMFFLVYCPVPISLLRIILVLVIIVSLGSQCSETQHYEINYSSYV
jgi:hypothetical protein